MTRLSLPLAAVLLVSLAACSAPPSQGEALKDPKMIEDPAGPPPQKGEVLKNPEMIEDPARPRPPASSSKTVDAPIIEMIEDPYPGPGQAGSSSMAPPSDAATCDAGKAQSAIGKPATQAVVDRVVADSGARSARVIKPGMAVTMDFRPDRVNINVDAGNRITAIKCG